MPDNRNVRQYLQLLKSAGVSHLPLVKLQPAKTSAFRKAIKPGAVVEKPSAQAKVARPATTNQVSFAVNIPAVSDDTAAIIGKSFDSVEARQTGLTELSALVAKCQRCDILTNSRRQTVFGSGNPDARIMFIGEAPGADEDREGKPFVGAAGKLLDRIIEACGLKRDDLYICNILRCRPPGNRNPLPQEAANCREYLDGQIKIVKPDYIICWGTVAAQNLLGETRSVGNMRGQFMAHGPAKVLCTYHPSYLLRNASAKKLVWEDMKLFMAEMEADSQ